MKKTLLLLVALFTATFTFAYDIKINGVYYNLNNEDKTAEVTNNGSGMGDAYDQVEVTIPSKITYNGEDYDVTSIADDAFWISWESCLIYITIEAITPPTLNGELGFNGPIYIPDNTLSAYKEAWGTNYIFVNNETTLTIHVETPGTLSDKIFDAGQRPINVSKLIVTGTLNDDDFTYMRNTMTLLVDINLSGITNTTGVNFKDKSNLVKILLPENLTSIGNYAFYDCSSLTSITIPNSVTSIEGGAFSYCSNIAEIHISDIAKWCDIDFKANSSNPLNKNACLYVNGNKITELVIPEGVNSIKNYAFYNYAQLTSITIPNSVTSIGDWAFSDCSSLTSITIPNSVTSIGNEAFSGCRSLTSITIPNSVTSIGDWAFQSCSSLTSITIPNSVTSIGNEAFSGCRSLTSITIPNSVTSIGDWAFQSCSSLTSITCLGSTPPEASDLGANTSTCTLIVPKVAYNSYLRHAYWGQFLNIETIDVDYKKLTAIANNAEWGIVEGGGYYDNGKTATLTAIANEGYSFVKWSDEVTYNPRTVIVTQDSTFTAIFEANSFAITTAVNDDAMGSVTEGGEYAYGTEITLTATPNDGYRFTQWTDGNTDNPRIITVTENKTYTAEFEVEVFGVFAASEVPSMGGVKVTLTAEPIEGFEFVEWTDGNTDNPRILTLTENIEVYARFQMAQGGNPTDLKTSKISSANIYTTNNTLHIEGATTDYHILDAAGRLIYSGNAFTLQLPRGIYLITINGEIEKIVL